MNQNDRVRSRIIAALHEHCPESIVEYTDLTPIADSVIASLTSDGSITIHRDDAKCLDCGGVDDDHIANYYCPTFRAA